ncbi:hypothetical protein HELRODRAFT_85456, partial [Helobdella robusta]|uniref:Acyl-coa synthetase n=1 Tax=Helobdella robusta TaxID=6412 RepID=T1G5X3_HELRO
ISGETGKQLSYKELECKILQTADYFTKLGVKKGDVVTIFSPNNLDFPAIVLGSVFTGAICSPVNSLYTADELKKTVSLTKPKVIVTTSQLKNTVDQILPDCPFIKQVLLIGDQTDNFLGMHHLGSVTDFKDVNIAMDDVMTLAFSSGTTGAPKGVQQTHRNIVYNIQQAIHTERLDYIACDKLLAFLPYFHCYGYVINMLCGLTAGLTQIVISKFDPNLFFKCVKQYHCSYISAVPPVLLLMCRHPTATSTTLSHVRRLLVGATTLPRNLIDEVRVKLNKDAIIKQGYGMTETGPLVSISLTSLPKDGSVGHVLPHTKIKAVDENNQALPRNRAGELCIKGPQVMKGYFKNAAADAQTFTEDGWLRTGDVGFADSDGFIFIVDRCKDLIKVKGFQVAPAELESILLSHPLVADSAVIGVPDDQLGEKPRAYVVLKKDGSVREEELVRFVAEKVAPFKQLKGGVQFVDQIPKSPTGKLLKKVLREAA